ncbi:hypothetical protein OF83DRAFT_1153507 [Amylostereum chailletii]|nr:hypothetical protein OF83DRAFT_1153507 [Amylostereum chailletii]
MGSSAGGHLAAVTALRTRDDPNHPPTDQLLQIPVTCHPDQHPELSARLSSLTFSNLPRDDVLGLP